jgi:hypothetical protein
MNCPEAYRENKKKKKKTRKHRTINDLLKITKKLKT